MFIVLEGIDQCGKGTQAELLINYFNNQNKKVVHLREPGGTELSEQIRELVMMNKKIDINSMAEMLLYSASRAQLQSKIKEYLEQDYIIICERYYYSTLAYQGFGRGMDLQKIKYLMQNIIECIEPDLVFYLEIDLETMIARRIAKNHDNDRMEESGFEFYQKVIEGYSKIAEEFNFKKINGSKNIKEIFFELKNAINEL